MDADANPFAVLGVSPDVDDASVRKSYARLLREARAAADDAAAERIQKAYESIRDPEPRARLRRLLEEGDKHQAPLEAARLLIAAGNLREARNALRAILTGSPRNEQVLMELVHVECGLEKFDTAVATSRKLLECAPGNPDYWVLRARALASHAETLARPAHRDEHLKNALKHVRKAKDLGDQSASTQVLESDLLRATGRELAASKLLKSRLNEAAELKSDELEMALALLRQHASQSHGRGFQDAIDALAQALPEAEERRRTVAHALCRLAADLLPVRPAAGIKCVELAEVCSPEDATVQSLVQACEQHKGRLEHRAERMAVAAASEVGQRLESANRGVGWWTWWGATSGWGSHWGTWLITFLLLKATVLGLMRNCGRDKPPAPAGVIVDDDGKITHVIDAKGRQVPIEELEAKAKTRGKKSAKKKRPPQPEAAEEE